MKVFAFDELRDLRGPALGVALASLGHELVNDPKKASAILASDPKAPKVVKLAAGTKATTLTHAAFFQKTDAGKALLRFGSLLSIALDSVKGIGVGIDEPLGQAKDPKTMLDIVALFMTPKRPLGLGYQLVFAAQTFAERKQTDLALRALELAFASRDDLARWATGEPTGALALALGLLADAKTIDPKQARSFLAHVKTNESDALVHLQAARLYVALKDTTSAAKALATFLDHSALRLSEVERDPKLASLRQTPAYAVAAKKARALLPDDPNGVLAPLLANPSALAKLHPAPFARKQPLATASAQLDLFGILPEPLFVWLEFLDRWDIGYLEIYDFKAWNPTPSRRSWNPPPVPKESANAFAALFEHDALKSDDWKERLRSSTLSLVLAGALPIGRTEWDAGEFGVDTETGEVILVDRDKDECAIVASDLGAFLAYETRAFVRGKKAKKEALPKELAPRVAFSPKTSRGVYANHGAGAWVSTSKLLTNARRARFISDLLLGIPKVKDIVGAYVAHAEDGAALAPVLASPEIAVADALYWLFHLFFTGEDAALATLLERTKTSKSRYVRDASTIIERALAKKGKLGQVDLGKQREVFLKALGRKKTALSSTTKPTSKAARPEETVVDQDALLAAVARRETKLGASPKDEGAITAAGLKKRIADLPDTVGSFFEAVQRPEMPGGGSWDFIVSLLLHDLLGELSKTSRTKKLSTTKEITVFFGDLEVKGDVEFSGLMIVLGDLVVDGVLRDTDEFSHLWVTGKLDAKAIHCAFTLWVGETVQTNAFVLGRRGNAFALEGIDTPLAIRNDYEGDGFRGELRAKHHIDVEKDDAPLKTLVRPSYLEEEDDYVNLDADKLTADAARGKNVLSA